MASFKVRSAVIQVWVLTMKTLEQCLELDVRIPRAPLSRMHDEGSVESLIIKRDQSVKSVLYLRLRYLLKSGTSSTSILVKAASKRPVAGKLRLH